MQFAGDHLRRLTTTTPPGPVSNLLGWAGVNRYERNRRRCRGSLRSRCRTGCRLGLSVAFPTDRAPWLTRCAGNSRASIVVCDPIRRRSRAHRPFVSAQRPLPTGYLVTTRTRPPTFADSIRPLRAGPSGAGPILRERTTRPSTVTVRTSAIVIGTGGPAARTFAARLIAGRPITVPPASFTRHAALVTSTGSFPPTLAIRAFTRRPFTRCGRPTEATHPEAVAYPVVAGRCSGAPSGGSPPGAPNAVAFPCPPTPAAVAGWAGRRSSPPASIAGWHRGTAGTAISVNSTRTSVVAAWRTSPRFDAEAPCRRTLAAGRTPIPRAVAIAPTDIPAGQLPRVARNRRCATRTTAPVLTNTAIGSRPSGGRTLATASRRRAPTVTANRSISAPARPAGRRPSLRTGSGRTVPGSIRSTTRAWSAASRVRGRGSPGSELVVVRHKAVNTSGSPTLATAVRRPGKE